MFKEMLDVLMPRECLVCGRRLGAQESQLCIWCAADLPFTYYWESLWNPMADAFNALLEQLRPEDMKLAYAPAAALLFYHHGNPYKMIPRALKYGGRQDAGRFFGALLGRRLRSSVVFAGVDAVVPVPLSALRHWRRGYNQAAVLAGAVARELGARLCPHALGRRRSRSQTSLSAKERLRNVRGVFYLRRGLPPGCRYVLLVDDTFTTGATLSACYYVLRTALGPEVRIGIATLAAVQA